MVDQLADEISKWLQINGSPGECLRELRQKRGLTQQDVASVVGCSDNIVSRIERDEQPFRNVAEVMQFAKALDCSDFETAELLEAFLFMQNRINLWITCRLFIESPTNPAYQKAFRTVLNTVLREETFTQEQKNQNNRNAKKRRMEPLLNGLVMILIVAGAMVLVLVRSPILFASRPVPTMVLTTVSTVVLNTLYADDFESGTLNLWDNASGIGQIVQDGDQHILQLENKAGSYVIFQMNQRPLADYTAEAWVRILRSTPNYTDLFVNIRTNSEGSYSGGLDIESATLNMLATVNGVFNDLGAKTVGLALNQWVNIRLRAVGNKIELFMNERLLLSATHSYHLAGVLSFSVAPGTFIQLDNVRILGE